MFITSCPKCKARISLFPHSLKEWFNGKRRCSGCETWIVLSTPIIFVVIGVWIFDYLEFGNLSVNSRYYVFGSGLVRLATLVFIAWLMTPLYLKIYETSWRVVEDELQDSAEIRKWKRIRLIGSWIGIIIGGIISNIGTRIIPYRVAYFPANYEYNALIKYLTPLVKHYAIAILLMRIGLIAVIVAITLVIVASFKINKAQIIQKQKLQKLP